MNDLFEQRRIIHLVHSDQWRQHCRGLRTIAGVLPLLSLDEIQIQMSLHPESIVLIEFSLANVAEHCVKIRRLANNPYDVLFVGVGDETMQASSDLVMQSGVTAHFWSIFEIKRLERMLKSHFAQRPMRQDSLENQLNSNLPWKAVSQ